MTKNEWIGLILILAALAAVAMRPSIRGNDGVGHYVYLASLVRGGDLDFSDDYRAFDALKQYPYRFAELPVDARTGLATNRYGIGAALLWSPFVLATHGLVRLVRPDLATGISRPYEWAVGVGTAFWGSVGLALIYWRLRRQWGRLPAGATLAGLLLATPLGFYLYAHGSMSHGVSFFAMTGAMLFFERVWSRPAWPLLAGLGFWLGLLVMIRFQDATWVLLLAGALTWRLLLNPRARSHHRHGFVLLAATGVLALATFLPQMAVWKILYGSWLSGPSPYLNASAGSFQLWPRHLSGVLFSEHGGVLAWHPLMALGLIGLMALARRPNLFRLLAWVGLGGFALQLWLIASWSAWAGGASFGNRFFISSLPFLAPGMAWWMAMARSCRRKALSVALLAALIAWNMGLLVQYALEMIPREESVPWSRVIKQNVCDVPRLLAQRLSGRLE